MNAKRPDGWIARFLEIVAMLTLAPPRSRPQQRQMHARVVLAAMVMVLVPLLILIGLALFFRWMRPEP